MMPMNFLGRSNWKRKKRVQTMILVVLAGLSSGTMVAGFILFYASKK